MPSLESMMSRPDNLVERDSSDSLMNVLTSAQSEQLSLLRELRNLLSEGNEITKSGVNKSKTVFPFKREDD